MQAMTNCDVCGNAYDKPLQITQSGRTMTFDSFECAIQAMAPHCGHCSCRIIGHGIETDGAMYCCVHCAKMMGVTDVRDRSHQG
jgi:hypothetical protein